MVEQLLVHVILSVYLILQKQADTYDRTTPGTLHSLCFFDPTHMVGQFVVHVCLFDPTEVG